MENRLKMIRNEQGMTQAEFAEKLEISVRTYQNYEQGIRAVPEKVLQKAGKFDNVEESGKLHKLCPYKIVRKFEKDGRETERFCNCIGSRCMAYDNGKCRRQV